MTIKKWQNDVDEWITTIGVRYFDVMTNTILLSEEVGEFSRIVARKYGEQSFKSPLTSTQAKERLADELADIIFVSTCLANQLEIDLTSSLKKNIQKKTQRDHQRHQRNDKIQSK